jgi:hypothetical protein
MLGKRQGISHILVTFFVGLLARSLCVSGRSCDQHLEANFLDFPASLSKCLHCPQFQVTTVT